MNLEAMQKIAVDLTPERPANARRDTDWKARQDLRAPRGTLLADSWKIRIGGLQLRTVREWRGGRVRRTGNVLEERDAWLGVLSADGRAVGIRARIRDSVKRALAIGLGKMRRLA